MGCVFVLISAGTSVERDNRRLETVLLCEGIQQSNRKITLLALSFDTYKSLPYQHLNNDDNEGITAEVGRGLFKQQLKLHPLALRAIFR